MLSRFDRIPKRGERTDRQTDRIAISISHVSVLTRDKNRQNSIVLPGVVVRMPDGGSDVHKDEQQNERHCTT